jgi:hypothetical protein
MAINWPSLAQGGSTGTTYTAPSPGSNIWTWSGYAWGSKGTTAKGGFGGPWVIFNSYGKARSYSTLQEAITFANPGDDIETINLFGDTTEYPTGGNHVILNKNININLNGNTYTLDVRFNPLLDSVNLISNNSTEVDVKITNGKIKLTNVAQDKNVRLIGETSSSLNYGCNWIFSSTLFESDSGNGFVGIFISSITGGTFYHTSSTGPALSIVPNSMTYNSRNIYRDITAISNFADAISFVGGGTGTLSICINCKGISYKYDETANYSGIIISGPAYGGNNRLRLNRCLGANLASGSTGLGYGIMSYGKGSKVIQSVGESRNGGGIYTEGSDLIHCTGDGENAEAGCSFYSFGGSVLRRCTSVSNLNIIGLRTAGQTVSSIISDKIENCTLNGLYPLYGPGGASGNYINVYNTIMKGSVYGVYYVVSNYKTKIINSVVIPNPTESSFIPIILGGTGSYVINNVIEGTGEYYAIEAGNEYLPRVLIAGNTCINTYGLKSSFITQGMSISIDTQNMIGLTAGQPI